MSQSQQAPLQRSKSAPLTVSSLGEGKPLARTLSHEHVQSRARPLATKEQQQQQQPRRQMVKRALEDFEEDPFNLLTFYPRGLGRRDEGRWQSWVREEIGTTEEEEEGDVWDDEGVESPTIFTPVEDNHSTEALKGEARLFEEEEGVLLSPYQLEDAVDEESLFEHMRRRREGGSNVMFVGV